MSARELKRVDKFRELTPDETRNIALPADWDGLKLVSLERVHTPDFELMQCLLVAGKLGFVVRIDHNKLVVTVALT